MLLHNKWGGGITVHQMIDFDERRVLPNGSSVKEFYPIGSSYPVVDAVTQGHIYYLDLMLESEGGVFSQNMQPYIGGGSRVLGNWYLLTYNNGYRCRSTATVNTALSVGYTSFRLYKETAEPDTITVTCRPMMFDLTADFGAGNEPSLEDFRALLNGRYLPYGENTIS